MAEYDAGSAFVSILPSTRGFAQRLKREIAGVQADVTVPVRPELDRRQLSGLEAALKALPAVVLDADATQADREIAALRQRLEDLSSKTVGIDVSAAEAHREVDSVRSELERLGRESPDIAVRVDAAAASSALADVTAESARLDGRTAKVKVDANVSGALTSVGTLRSAVGTLNGNTFGFRFDADVLGAAADIATLLMAVNQLANKQYDFTIKANTAGAVASVAGLVAKVAALGGLAGVVAGLGGALGGLGAAGVVAGAGLGATLLASLGVGKALSALSAQQDSQAATGRQAAKQAQAQAQAVVAAQDRVTESAARVSLARSDSARNVARAEADAEKSVDAARRQAQSSLESAVSAKEAADRRASRSTRDLRMAQSELTSAWEAGRRSLEDLQDQLDSSLIDQRQAGADLREARKALDAAMATGDADQIEQAQIGYDRAKESVDQLGKRVQRLQTDNQAASVKGVAGTEQYRSAIGRVQAAEEQRADAVRSAGDAAAAVEKARADGNRAIEEAELAGRQRVDDAREQGARQVAAAEDAAVDAQRALTQALAQTGDAGAAAGDKVASAFADLSPAAAAFALYLFSLKPLLQDLAGVAAGQFFPPLQAGLGLLVAQAPAVRGMVSQLAGAMGTALGGVLAQLASPWWMGFFSILANASGTLIPGLFNALMRLAGAAAILLVHLLPLAPAGFALLDQVTALVIALAPFVAQLLAGCIPAASAFLAALTPLGPVLGALQPILLVLGQAFSQVLAAVLTALAPILVALTPLIQALATQIATGLVASIQAATPWLVGIAQWMSAHPALVLGVVSAIGGLVGALQPLSWVAGAVLTAFHNFVILSVVRSLLTSVGLEATLFGRAVLFLLSPVEVFRTLLSFLPRLLPSIGQGIMVIARSMLTAMGPVGWLITAFGLLYSTSQPFRDAINGLVGVLMGLVGQLASAVMPIFTALSSVLQMVAGVVGQLVGQLAAALVPVITMLAGVLSQLVGALLPPLLQIVGALVPVIMLVAQVFVQLVAGALGPLISLFAQLLGVVLPPLIGILTSVVIPVISFLANVIATVLCFVLQSVLMPILGAIVPAFQGVGMVAEWLWTNVLSPVFSAIGLAARILFAVILTVLITPLILAWQLVAAVATWLWSNVLQPTFAAIGAFISWVWTAILQPTFAALVWFWQNVIAPAATWLYNTIILPIFNLIGAVIGFVWNWVIKPALTAMVWWWQMVIAPVLTWLYVSIVKPIWDAIGAAIMWVWTNVIKVAFDAVAGGLHWLGDRFVDATNWIRDIWGRIRGFLAKPINFMIDVVWNHGVVPAWNAVAGLVGLGPIAPLGLIPEARTGGQVGAHVDGRGLIHGPGTGTSDSILARVTETRSPLAVSKDEFLVNAATTSRVLPFLTALNAGNGEALQAAGGTRAGRGGTFHGRSAIGLRDGGLVAGVIPGLADGGAIERVDATKRWLSGEAQGIPYVWGGGARSGMDCSGMQAAVTHMLSGRNPYSGRIGTTASMPWGGFVPGLTSQYSIGNKPGDHMAGTLGGQNVEQHGPSGTPFQFPSRWGADNGYFPQKWSLPVVGGQFVSGGNGGGGGFFNWILDKARGAFDDLTNPAIDLVRRVVGEPPPEWKRVPPGLATKMRDTVRDFVFGKAEAAGGAMGPVGDGAPFVVGQISDAARGSGVGKDGAIIGTATGLVESNLTNLPGGDRDSVGVFQQRPSMGWGTIAECMNVLHAAMTFFSRFPRNWHGMVPGDVAQSVQRSAFPGKYQTRIPQATGLVNQFGGVFDRGGEAIGRGLMFKDVIAPEQMLDPVETRTGYRPLTAIARDLEAGRLEQPSGLSAQQIAAMTPDQAGFPTEFALVGGELELVGDGLARIVDGRLRAVTSELRTGRDT